MLSKSDRINILKFDELKPIHKRVLRARLKRKGRIAVRGIIDILADCNRIGLEVDDIVTADDIKALARSYAAQKELQIMYTEK